MLNLQDATLLKQQAFGINNQWQAIAITVAPM